MNKPFLQCSHEAKVWRTLWERIKPKVVIDAGANIGGYVETFLIDGAQKVHAFEPSPMWHAKLVDRFALDERVIINREGIGDREHTVFNCRTYNCHTLIPACDRRDEVPESIGQPGFDMQITTIDHYCNKNLVIPQFIKIDVDGYDVQALRGARRTMEFDRPLIVVEVSRLIEIVGSTVEQFADAVFDVGYHVMPMAGEYRVTNKEDLFPVFPHDSSCDVMLVPKEVTV